MLSENQVLHQGRYRIIHQFGNSVSSSLYEAYDTASETKVVVRERSGSITSNVTPGQLETLKITFAEQAKRLSDIKHDALLGIRDFFSETGRQYLVLESFDGQDLTDFTAIGAAPAMSDVLKWADQLLDALEYLHGRMPAIIHQNINPQNIRLTSEFKIKLLLTTGDPEEDQPESSDGAINYKALEQLWLGLDYASQKVIANSLEEKSEQILREPPDARTDVYGLAATLYHVLTGVTPADPLARVIDILDGNRDPLEAPHSINESIPKGISDVVMKALEIKREDRFSSASELRNSLKAMSSFVQPLPKKASSVPPAEAPQEQPQAAAIKTPEASTVQAEPAKQEPISKPEPTPVSKPQLKSYKPTSNVSAPNLNSSPLDDLKLELAGDDLLDLPEDGPVVTATPAPPATNVLSLDAKPIITETEFGSSLSAVEKKSGLLGNPMLIVGALAGVLIVGIGGWFILGSSSNSQVTPAATVTVPSQTTSSTAQQPPAAEMPVISETVTVSADAAKTDAEHKTEADRRAEADRKAKKAANAEVKPTPEKKKVTVDDLINDN